MVKVGILNPFFSRYFLGVLTHFMALFMAGNTHSLLFSNILLMRHQSSADAIGEEKIVKNANKLQALQSVLCFSPIYDTFSVLHVFESDVQGKIMCLRKCWCFLQGWYLCKIERRAVVYIFRKDVYQEFNFWTIFCTDKI